MTGRLADQGSLKLFQDVEMPLVPVLAEIERNGFLLDVPGLQTLSKELERELKRKEAALAEAAALIILKKKANAIWGDGEDD